jgi:hypothetical protein
MRRSRATLVFPLTLARQVWLANARRGVVTKLVEMRAEHIEIRSRLDRTEWAETQVDKINASSLKIPTMNSWLTQTHQT